MGKIQYPPPTPQQSLIQLDFVYGEELEIEFDVSGYFSHSNPDAFAPDPPTGNFIAPPTVTLRQYYAGLEPTKVTFTYFDTENGSTYNYEITITAPPEPPSSPSKN
jgi:hypothetical protein